MLNLSSLALAYRSRTSLLIVVFNACLSFQWTGAGPAGVHGALVLSLVVTADKSACVNVMHPCRSMVANSAMGQRENSTIARRMTVQVNNN